MNQKTAKKLRKIARQTAVEQDLPLENEYVIHSKGKGVVSLNKCLKGLYRYAKRQVKNDK